MKQEGCFLGVVTFAALTSCNSNVAPSPVPATVGQAEALLTARDSDFTTTQVCEDYELAIYLLALVQPPRDGTGNTTDAATLATDLASCPGTYSGVIAALNQHIAALHDYHTYLDVGDDAITGVFFFPTVTSCDTPSLCGSTIGSTLMPMLGGDDQHLYGYAAKGDGGEILLGIEQINGLAPDAAIASAKATNILGLAALGGPVGREMVVLDGRTTFDGRDRSPVTIQAGDLVSGATVTMAADFDVPPTYVPAATDSRSLTSKASFPARSYGCIDLAPNSNTEYGSCLTDQGRLVVWIHTFEPTITDPGVMALVTSYLAAQLDAASQPVFLDLRGNGGGYFYLMMSFLCTFGDDLVVQAITNRQLVTSYYPAQFILSSGRVVQFGAEIGLAPGIPGYSDEPITMDDPTWTVSSTAPDANRRTFTSSWWDLVASMVAPNASVCASMRDERFAQVQWVVGTMGPEFSATEFALDLLSASPTRFLQVGSITMGGSGIPDVVTLPNTKLLLHVAKTREMNGQGTWLIEDRRRTERDERSGSSFRLRAAHGRSVGGYGRARVVVQRYPVSNRGSADAPGRGGSRCGRWRRRCRRARRCGGRRWS